MMATLKINWRILWNNIIKKFQVKHGQCDESIIFLKKLSLEGSRTYHRTAVIICKGV